ncbi:hypothetical protein XELAEV_18029188mg [Xenopus laevis]|uniref:Uncharacterized protein n=1 Tax=Xenopus laevis TaxID=8355 RepID=A0A974CTH6_XENLA|nr:hypothetical protein XELAEV_18029188mg [Xenopus laevis]
MLALWTWSGTLLHVLWDCAAIQKYWSEILSICNDKLKLSIEATPAAVLQHHNTTLQHLYNKSLTQYALNAAKILIPCKWKSTLLPTLSEWRAQMEENRKFEEIHAKS